MNTRIAYILALSFTTALFTIACGDSDEDAEDNTGTVELPAEAAEATKTYSKIVLASYEDSLAEAKRMDAAIEALNADPTETNLQNARQAWLDSREPYLQTEVYRFYDGPIDNPDDGPEGLINAWPMDEQYIDYTVDAPSAGIIQDTSKPIDGPSLEALNEQGGEENIATGYHAIEFLLWGQDLSDNGPGERPSTDYADSGDAPSPDRRRLYLKTTSTLLVGHLESLVSAWGEGGSNYRAEFEGTSDKEAFRRILTGMIVLSGFETGGERLQTALDSGSQEDEHSCFSDNTHRDMVQDVVGVQNVWRGVYTRIDGSKVEGTGIQAIVETIDPDLAVELNTQIDESVQRANALQPPFDQEIAPSNTAGRQRVTDLVTSLRAQERLLEKLFLKLGLTIPEVE